MSDKKYIMHYPSSFGMGSNTDTFLINDDDLRFIIRKEVERKRRSENESCQRWGDRGFCDRMTGTWGKNEKFCDSEDITEIEEDVIQKRLSSCSTYAHVNDLIPVPDNVPLTVMTEQMQDTIFHIWNEWDYYIDIIAGETTFTRNFLDLTREEDFAGLEGGKIHEFVSFDMKRVLENNYFFNTIEEELEIQERRCLRFESKLKGTYINNGEHYYDDCVDVDIEKCYKEYKKEWDDVIKIFSEPVIAEDTYLKNMYTKMHNEFMNKQLKRDLKKIRRFDFRKLVYKYPGLFESFGSVWYGEIEDKRFFRYDELFKKGCNVKYLPAS